MAATGYYRYDPENYHGPLHFYAVYVSTRLFGRNLLALRLPAVVASLGCVVAGLLFAPYLGRSVALVGAFAIAISPAFVFYGRYSIHESWQVLFLMLSTLSVFMLTSKRENRRNGWPLLGLSMAGLAVTKETFIIHLGTGIIAAALLWAVGRLIPRLEWRFELDKAALEWRQIAQGLYLFTLFAGMLFSGFLVYPEGVLDFFRSFGFWFKTGFDNACGHGKPPWYWLELMACYEWVMLAGLCATLVCWFPGCAKLRWFSLSAAGVFLAYSLIPYKTPWCLISIVWPLPFILGTLALRLPFGLRAWGLRSCILAAIVGLWPCVRLNFFRHSDPQEPFVYVQTSPEISRFTGPLLALVSSDPRRYSLSGAVYLDGPYPLPWLLGDFHAIGYFEGGLRPASFNFDFVVAEQWRAREIEQAFEEDYYFIDFQLRDGRPPVRAWFRAAMFAGVFWEREPEIRANKETAE